MSWRVLALGCLLGLLGWAVMIAIYEAAPGLAFALVIGGLFAEVFARERRVKARNDARRQRMRDDARRRAEA